MYLRRPFQWETIQGRRPGKPLTPAGFAGAAERGDFPEQQLQPLPCACFKLDSVRGADALRSFVACARLRSTDIVARYGTVRYARGASLSHCGQARGSSHSAIGRMSVKGPHWVQR
jgi:hypothetical protein